MRKLILCAVSVCLATMARSETARADSVTVCFRTQSGLYLAPREVPPGASPVEAAIHALAAGPTADEQAAGILSAIPSGTAILGLSVAGDETTVEFSADIVADGMTEERLSAIYQQVAWTLKPFGLAERISLIGNGQPLTSYLPPVQKIVGAAVKPVPGLLGSLTGRSVTLSPGHGYYWTGSSWSTARPVYCSPLNQEDLHNLEMCIYLEKYLLADGMTVRMARCTNKNFGTHAPSAKPWWQVGAYLWIQNLGYPCSVYASSTGDCTTGTGSSESSDDIRSRPLMSDYDNTDIYVSLHTNGYTGDCTGSGCPTGIETYYDASTEHAPWGTVSQALGNAINPNIISTINACMPEISPDMGCHGTCVKDSNGAYGEIRIPDRAATLTELGFHDTCDRDALFLRDNFYRSAAMWGMYKGICQYFGVTPTYDKYSSEYVSDTIPTTMVQGQTYNVSVTMRNRGVVWSEARSFRLGAVGDSDPLTTVTRVTISGEVGPADTYTFSFQMQPSASGDFTTDWRMVRDGFQWFGATLTKNVHVDPNPDTEPPSTPTNLTGSAVNPTTVQLNWTASTDNYGVAGYEIRRNGATIGTSPTNSYTDTTASPGGSYDYEVRAYDNGSNYSGWSTPVHVDTPTSDTVPPSIPTNLTAVATGPTSVQLNWTASTDNVAVTGYDVRRNGAIIASPTTNSYTDNTVVASTSYTYEVRAKDAVPNYSAWSNPAAVNTPAAMVVVFQDGFNGNLNNWTQGAAPFTYDGTVNHGSITGPGSALCAAGASSQMYRPFSRPFASGKVSGWYRDPTGGKNGTTCSYTGARQALSLREPAGGATFILDNGLSQNGGANYTWRLVGVGGSATHTAYAARNTAASCSPTWIYYETVVSANAPNASPAATFTVKVNDGGAGMPVSATDNIPSQTFYTATNTGIGRITLGLGVSTTGANVYWDDIKFEAAPPAPPISAPPSSITASQIRWNFAGFDYNLYGFDVADAGGTVVSPNYPNAGWLNRNSTSWTETGLAANTQYTRKVRAWNGELNSAYSEPQSAWTLSVPPTAGSVAPDKASACVNESITWTAVGGFGAGKVQYYRWAWDQNPTRTFTGDEDAWSGGTLSTVPTAPGTWYLHVRGYNGEDVANGSYDYVVTTKAATETTQQPSSQTVHSNATVQFVVVGSGAGTLSYQWQKDEVDLTDGGRISGATTPMLTLSAADRSDNGAYRCVIGGECGTVISDVASLTVAAPGDLDMDGDVDGTDFGTFAGCFNGTGNPITPGCEAADLNGDNSVDGNDYGVFSGCFNGTGNPAGC